MLIIVDGKDEMKDALITMSWKKSGGKDKKSSAKHTMTWRERLK